MPNKKLEKNNINQEREQEFSQESGNLEIVNIDSNESVNSQNDAVILGQDGLDVKKSGNIIIGKLNVITAPLKRRHEKHYKESTFHLLADIALALIVLGLVGALMWLIFLYPIRDGVGIEVDLKNGVVASGKTETFEIFYYNKGDNEVKNSNISIDLPDNFLLESIVPANAFDNKTNTFKIGDLSSGANGKIKIVGTVFGAVGSHQVLSAVLNYNGVNGSRQKNVLSSAIFNIEESVLNMDVVIPDKIYKDIDFEGKIKIVNNSKKTIDNIEIFIDEFGWEIKRSDCSMNNNIIIIDSLKAGEIKNINFNAVSSNSEGKSSFLLSSYVVVGGEKLKQETVMRGILIKSPNFKVSLDANNKNIHNGDKVFFTLNYNNQEKEKIEDVRFTISAGSSDFNIDNLSLSEDSGICRKERDVIVLSGNLEPGNNGQIVFSVNLNDKKISTNREMYIIAMVEYKMGGQVVKYNINSQSVKLLSNLNVISGGYYYSNQGDQLGIGPLPPVVDIPTSYWVFWEIENFGNDLEDFSVVGQLPEGVVWTGNKTLSAGKLQYAQIGGRIIWSVDSIDKSGGDYKVGIELQVVPSSKDVGKVLPILNDIEYSAKDVFCEENITGNLLNIDTNIRFDRLAGGKGVVQKID